jgi:hypothetical protein
VTDGGSVMAREARGVHATYGWLGGLGVGVYTLIVEDSALRQSAHLAVSYSSLEMM